MNYVRVSALAIVALAISFSLSNLVFAASVYTVCTAAIGPNCSTALPCSSMGCGWTAAACTTVPFPLGLCLDGLSFGCFDTNWCIGSCAGSPLSTCYCTADGCG